MANFFDEERIQCKECNQELFQIFNSTILVKKNNEIKEVPYKKVAQCINCGKIIVIDERR